MKRLLYILLLSLLCLPASAKKTKQATVAPSTTPQEQCFDYYFYAAENSLYNGSLDDAFLLFNYCNTLQANNPTVLHHLATLYDAIGNTEKSFAYAEKAYTLSPGDYWEHYVDKLVAADQLTEAISLLQKAHKLNPKDDDVLYALYSTAYRAGDYDMALFAIGELQTIEGVTEQLLLTQVRLLYILKMNADAFWVINQYLESHPDDTFFRIVKGDLYANLNNFSAARQTYVEEVNLHPHNAEALTRLLDLDLILDNGREAEQCVYGLINSSELSLQEKIDVLNKYPEVAHYTKVTYIHLMFELLSQYEYEPESHMLIAKYYADDMRIDDLKERFYRIQTVDPTYEPVYDLMVQTLDKDSAYTELRDSIINVAYNLFPNNTKWAFYRAAAEYNQEHYDEALMIIDKSISNEENEHLNYLLALCTEKGDILTQLERYDEAFEAYERALSIDPENNYVLNNYAYTLAIHGNDLAKAERMSQLTIKTEPDNPVFLDTYAWILYLRGNRTLAKFYIQKAMDSVMASGVTIDELAGHYVQIMYSK